MFNLSYNLTTLCFVVCFNFDFVVWLHNKFYCAFWFSVCLFICLFFAKEKHILFCHSKWNTNYSLLIPFLYMCCYSHSISIICISPSLTRAVDLSQYFQLQLLSFLFVLFCFLLKKVTLTVKQRTLPCILCNLQLYYTHPHSLWQFCRIDGCNTSFFFLAHPC